jgi:hypothetical protein
LIELIGSNNVSSLQKLSKKKGEAPQQIWASEYWWQANPQIYSSLEEGQSASTIPTTAPRPQSAITGHGGKRLVVK